jgi:hypothetical protein
MCREAELNATHSIQGSLYLHNSFIPKLKVNNMVHLPLVKLVEYDPISNSGTVQSDKGEYRLVNESLTGDLGKLCLYKEETKMGSIITQRDKGDIFTPDPQRSFGTKIAIYNITNGKYQVTPIKNKNPVESERQEIHPLDFLLERL